MKGLAPFCFDAFEGALADRISIPLKTNHLTNELSVFLAQHAPTDKSTSALSTCALNLEIHQISSSVPRLASPIYIAKAED